MSIEIVLVLTILLGTVVILATGLLRMDVAALLVLVLVALLGLVSPRQAIAGFANPAVLTVGGMFVISAGLSRTGVAELLGSWILRKWGGGERRVMTAITLVSGLLSGFMNNVGVTAMMLPVVVTIARKSSIAPSKLLIPMALGAQLGGFTTLVGTAPNLLAADSLSDAGLEPFGLFAFTPVGLVLLGVGTVFIAVTAPRILPVRVPDRGGGGAVDRPAIQPDVELEERLFFLIVPPSSLLEGKTLEQSLIGSALGVHVLAVLRDGRTHRAPRPDLALQSGDRILVQGRPDYFLELRGRRHLAAENEEVTSEWLESEAIGLARAWVRPGSGFVGMSAAELDLRAREDVLVLTLRRGEDFRRRTHFVDEPMAEGDELLLQGSRERLRELAEGPDIRDLEFLGASEAVRSFGLEDRLWSMRVTEDSLMAGRSLGRTRLGDAVGFLVLAVARNDDDEQRRISLMPGPEFSFRAGDHLMVKARPEDMAVLRGLQRLEVDLESEIDPDLLEGGNAGFAEAVLAPRSTLIGKTLRQVNFRSRFGLHVVGIVREGEVVRSNLRDETLRFGDALLLYGPVRSQRSLTDEPDLILVRGREMDAPQPRLAPLSLLVTAAALVPVIAGWVPVAIGVMTGAVLMVLTRCLTPDQAYRAVDLPTLVLVSGMLALGAALSETGAVDLLGSGLLGAMGGAGPHLMLAALVGVTAIGGQIMPASAVVVFMAPIAISAANLLEVSPYPMVLAVAIASTSLASPVSQPPHALVMAPAGYRMGDYLRLGVPITVLVLILTILVTPIFLPF